MKSSYIISRLKANDTALNGAIRALIRPKEKSFAVSSEGFRIRLLGPGRYHLRALFDVWNHNY